MALGLIEIVGLPAAIEAADTAVKSANVKLLGYELTKGGGLVTVKLMGEVGAIKSAVAAGAAAGGRVGKVWSMLVIPRPYRETGEMVCPNAFMVCPNSFPEVHVSDELINEGTSSGVPEVEANEDDEQIELKDELKDDLNDDLKVEAVEDEVREDQEFESNEICNLCGDPLCPRKKGEPRVNCLHYKYKEAEI